MSNPTWPATLPQDPYDDNGPSIEPADNLVRTQQEGGPYKQRPRFTAVPSTVKFNLELTADQVGTLETFRKVTLGYAGVFDWKDLVSGAAATYRFSKPPQFKFKAGDYWTAAIELEQMP